LTIAKRETLSARLVRVMTERIQDGTYARGDRLPTEMELIEEFGVSRTVVREAVANLRASGAVATRQGIGAFVVQDVVTPGFRISEDSLQLVEEVIAALELRMVVESEAAALAAMRRTNEDIDALYSALRRSEIELEVGESAVRSDLEFHRAVAAATANAHFLGIFNYLGEVLIPRSRLQTHRFDQSSAEQYNQRILSEHKLIASSIERKDPDQARAAMRMHLGGSRDRLIASRRKVSADKKAR
jgi:GntR family transcriptional repressor for pyruvate dehydrogenase complex